MKTAGHICIRQVHQILSQHENRPSVLVAVLHICVLSPFVHFVISVKHEQEAQLAENGAFQKTRLTLCKLYIYTVLGSLLQLPTLVRWNIGHLYLLKRM